MIHMTLKWHHIDKCNKNCTKVDVLTPTLACLSSFAHVGFVHGFCESGAMINEKFLMKHLQNCTILLNTWMFLRFFSGGISIISEIFLRSSDFLSLKTI